MGAEISVDESINVSSEVVKSFSSVQTRGSVIDYLCGDNDSNNDSTDSTNNITIDANKVVSNSSSGSISSGSISLTGVCPHTIQEAYAKNTRSISDEFHSNRYNPKIMISNIKTEFENFVLPPDLSSQSKLCFICCNSYEGSRYALGDSAINDGLLSYINFKRLGYDAYIFHDMTKHGYMNVFTQFLQAEVDKVVVYYIGHGTNTRDTSGDEADGYDECLFFTDGVIIDDDLCLAITDNKANGSKLILLTDCCHSGTIYDVPDRKDILSISAAADNETAKQDWIEKKGQGIFTYYFWKYYNADIDLQSLQTAMERHLKKYKQSFITNKVKKNIKGLL